MREQEIAKRKLEERLVVLEERLKESDRLAPAGMEIVWLKDRVGELELLRTKGVFCPTCGKRKKS